MLPGRRLVGFLLFGILVVTFAGVIIKWTLKLALLALAGYVALRILKHLLRSDSSPQSVPEPTIEPPSPSTAPDVSSVKTSGWLRERIRLVGQFALEVVAGTLAGALLGVIAGWDSNDRTSTIVVGSVVGAALGALAGFRSVVAVTEEDEPAPQPDGTS